MRQVFHFSPFYSWRTLKLREVKQLAWYHTAWKWANLSLNATLTPNPCAPFFSGPEVKDRQVICEESSVLTQCSAPGQKTCIALFFVSTPVPSSGPFCPEHSYDHVARKIAFCPLHCTAGFHLSPWTWMFLDPGVFKHSYLPWAMGVLHFLMCTLSFLWYVVQEPRMGWERLKLWSLFCCPSILEQVIELLWGSGDNHIRPLSMKALSEMQCGTIDGCREVSIPKVLNRMTPLTVWSGFAMMCRQLIIQC